MHFGRRTNLWLMGWYVFIEVWVITELTVASSKSMAAHDQKLEHLIYLLAQR